MGIAPLLLAGLYCIGLLTVESQLFLLFQLYDPEIPFLGIYLPKPKTLI